MVAAAGAQHATISMHYFLKSDNVFTRIMEVETSSIVAYRDPLPGNDSETNNETKPATKTDS
jgi:hypothetical protein